MYSRKERVTTSCTDETGTQTLISMVTMMQDCSMLWMEEQPVLDAWLQEVNGVMMVASREVEVRRRPAYGERLTVSTWIYKCQSRMGYRNTCIFDESGEAVAACWCIGVFVSRDTGAALKVPKEVIDSMLVESAFEMDYGKRRISLPDVEPKVLPSVTAVRTDIDFNGHVNNAQYVRMAYENLPSGFYPTHLRITHDGQAKCGDVISTTLYRDGSTYVFVLGGGGEGRDYAIIEFR